MFSKVSILIQMLFCQNNGTCDSVSGNATCACPPEYTGPTCAGNIYDDSEEKAS